MYLWLLYLHAQLHSITLQKTVIVAVTTAIKSNLILRSTAYVKEEESLEDQNSDGKIGLLVLDHTV
jgi:hypothetical protein